MSLNGYGPRSGNPRRQSLRDIAGAAVEAARAAGRLPPLLPDTRNPATSERAPEFISISEDDVEDEIEKGSPPSPDDTVAGAVSQWKAGQCRQPGKDALPLNKPRKDDGNSNASGSIPVAEGSKAVINHTPYISRSGLTRKRTIKPGTPPQHAKPCPQARVKKTHTKRSQVADRAYRGRRTNLSGIYRRVTRARANALGLALSRGL